VFIAQLNNKLSRAEEDMEDLLTSNIFGTCRYISIEITEMWLVPFLQTAIRIDGIRFTGPEGIVSLNMKFWPWMQEQDAKGAEPDVLIEIVTSDKRKWLLLIEAKYLSPKSSLADYRDRLPTDQLAREMNNLRKIAQLRHFDEYALFYVTAHTLLPKADITEAINELDEKTGDGASHRFYWTTWRRLPSILKDAIHSCEGSPGILLGDLQTILLRMGLSFFEGITNREWSLGESSWVFKLPTKLIIFEWAPISIAKYHFEGNPVKFLWSTQVPHNKMQWRWKS
jgi:hypothetical protein